MIVGYHVIYGAYGFWLPNDPRGSWSTFVGAWELFRYGPATKTSEPRSLAYRPHDRQRRVAAKNALKRPPVLFSGPQARAVGMGMASYFAESQLPVWACAILPDHVHLVVAPPKMDVEQLVIQLKGAATKSLKDQGFHPFGAIVDKKGRAPKCFGAGNGRCISIQETCRAPSGTSRKTQKKKEKGPNDGPS